jgi:hypothetical protein
MQFQCSSCSNKFTRKRNLKKHYITKHNSDSDIGVVCFLCDQMFGFGFENIETIDEDGHNERYHRPYTKMNKRKRDHKDKYKKTKSSGKIEIVNDCKMFPYPSTATIKRMSVTELADLTLSFTFSKMRQDFNI